jgi:arylsulfatase A-like enzyme
LADDLPTLPEVLRANGWATAAFTGGTTLDPRIGFGRGFDLYDTSMFKLRGKNIDRMLEWIANHRDRRTLLFWHTFEVHAPYLSGTFLHQAMNPEEASRLWRDLRRLRRSYDKPPTQEAIRLMNRHQAFTPEVSDALYDGAILSMDFKIGTVLDHLRRLGLYDDMLIIVTSDHGEQLGERDGRFYNFHGETLYDEMIRVPLIMKLPGSTFGGRRVARITRTIDVMPTILDVTQAPVSDLVIQGKSLRPLWESPETAASRLALTESVIRDNFELKSVRSPRYKYILRIGESDVRSNGRAVIPSEPESVELYDLEADPAETDNLLSTKGGTEDPAPFRQLAKDLDDALRARVSAQEGHALPVEGGEDNLEGLRALGYVE